MKYLAACASSDVVKERTQASSIDRIYLASQCPCIFRAFACIENHFSPICWCAWVCTIVRVDKNTQSQWYGNNLLAHLVEWVFVSRPLPGMSDRSDEWERVAASLPDKSARYNHVTVGFSQRYFAAAVLLKYSHRTSVKHPFRLSCLTHNSYAYW